MITYAIFRTFEDERVWLVKERSEEGPRGAAMESPSLTASVAV